MRSCKDIKAWIIGRSERATITFAEKTRILCKAVPLAATEWIHFSSLMIVCRPGLGRCRARMARFADTHGWRNDRPSARRQSRQPGRSEVSFMWCQVGCKSCTHRCAVRCDVQSSTALPVQDSARPDHGYGLVGSARPAAALVWKECVDRRL